MLQVSLESAAATEQLRRIEAGVSDLTPLYRVLAGTLEAETEANFAAQGRPSWKPLSEATKAARLKRNRGSSVLMILQDRGILAASVSSAYGADFAQVGAGGAAKDYAAIQQFGGTIERPRTRSRPGSAPIAKATCCARATRDSQEPRGVRQGQPQAGAGDLA
jgi:phage virion morphogenesis protein